MRKYLDTIKDRWFMEASPQQLALLRIATGSFSLWYLITRFDMLQKMVIKTEAFEPIGILNWMWQPLSPVLFWWVALFLILLNVLYLIGWKFRITGPTFALAMLLFFTYRNSWSMIYHNRNALVLHVMILGLVASADAWSWDSWKRSKNGEESPKAHWQYGWPIMLICAVTIAAYFLSGVAKLAGDLALEWANGSAMRSQVAVDAIRKELLGTESALLFHRIYKHTWLFLIMGILTFVLELGAPFALLRKRWGVSWAILTWMMHWGIFFIMGISFRYQMTGLIFLSFFNLERLWNPQVKNIERAQQSVEDPSTSTVLFDGVCNLCNGWIRFITKRDPNQQFRFASLQSEIGKQLLLDHQTETDLTSIVLMEDGHIYQKSDAILRICQNLRFPWPLAALLLAIPSVIRNRLYDLVARNRYRWFGKRQSCEIFTQDQRFRFLDMKDL